MNNTKDIVIASVKGLAKNCMSYVPIFGTMVDVYEEYAALQTQRKLKRLEDFYRELNEEVQHLNEDYISQADFLDIFEKTARYVVNERLEKKRLLYKNILLHSATTCSCSYDKTESYLRLLEQFSSLGIDIIAILHDPIAYNKENGMIIPDLPVHSGPGFHYTLKYDFVEQLQHLLKTSDKEAVIDELSFLESNRIILFGIKDRKAETNINPIVVLENSLTIKGKDFISFLMH